MNDSTLGEKRRRRASEIRSLKALAGSRPMLLPSQARALSERRELPHRPTALEHFEISHPRLALLIQQVLDTLNQMGI